MTGRCSFEAGSESLEAIKSYLECRSRGVEPLPTLSQAWEGFYAFYDPRLRKFLGKWALSDADRSDCLQEIWHEVLTCLGRFVDDPGRARLSTWLLTLARNKAVDAIRRRSRHTLVHLDGNDTEAADPAPDPAAAYERGRTLAQVHVALDVLAAKVSCTSFRVLYLRWIEGLTTAEVAVTLGITPAQVRSRTCRMKRKLRILLEGAFPGDALPDVGKSRPLKKRRPRNAAPPVGE